MFWRAVRAFRSQRLAPLSFCIYAKRLEIVIAVLQNHVLGLFQVSCKSSFYPALSLPLS
jgi:hypothetical protein